ncbi:putative reverse transcriptase domain-containing protein [Tanacetum coccineum]
MWNLKVKGTDVMAYNRRFQQLALMCARMFLEEVDKIEKYIGGLPDMILGSVKASKSKTMQEAIEFITELKEEKTHPMLHCNNCENVGPSAKDLEATAKANNNNRNNNNNNQKGNGCYECGAQGHFKITMLKTENNDRGNQAGNDRAPAKVYVVGNAGVNPDNVIAGTFLLNNRFAYILFDTGADRSFVSTAFSSQIDITPSTLDHYYDVELADGRIIGFNRYGMVGKNQAIIVVRERLFASPRKSHLTYTVMEVTRDLLEHLKSFRDKGFKEPVPHPGSFCLLVNKKMDHSGFALTIGLVGYYRRFIEGFSKIVKPISKLTQKNVKFVWGDKQEAAFQLLKQKLCSAPILALPEGSKDFIAYCDGSKIWFGPV